LFVALIGGLGMVWIVLAAHGAISGWSRWLYAVGGYRFEGRSAVEGADWSRLWMTLRDARLVLYPAVLAAAIYAMYDLGRWRLAGLKAHHAILPLWLVTGFAAFVTGGQFFHHYWVTITFPIGVTTAVLIGSIPSAAWRNLTIVLVLVMPLASTSRLTFLQRDRVPVEVAGYNRAVKEERVGEWFASNGRRGETLYVHCASAAAYAYADEDPIYPFLWFDNVRTARNAQDRLRSMFATLALRPTYVALFQSPSTCDPSGVVERTLEERYERLTTVDGVTIMHQVDPSATTAPHSPDLIG
jgi:hypothetical protein